MTADEFIEVYDIIVDSVFDDGRSMVMFFPRGEQLRLINARVPKTQLYRAFDPDERGRMKFLVESMIGGAALVDTVLGDE